MKHHSPLALYLLAVAGEYEPRLGPWSVEDDPENLMRVHLRSSRIDGLARLNVGSIVVDAGGDGALLTFDPDADRSDLLRLEHAIHCSLEHVHGIRQKQIRWARRAYVAATTPEGAP